MREPHLLPEAIALGTGEPQRTLKKGTVVDLGLRNEPFWESLWGGDWMCKGTRAGKSGV